MTRYTRKLVCAAVALLALAACRTASDAPPTHECVVTPHDLVECTQVGDE